MSTSGSMCLFTWFITCIKTEILVLFWQAIINYTLMKFNTKRISICVLIAAMSAVEASSSTIKICSKENEVYNPLNDTMIEAFKKRDYRSAYELIHFGADVNACGDSTPLEIIARKGDIVGAALILEKGAKINMIGLNGNTALHEAIDSDNLELVKYLLNYPCVINAKDKLGRTPLMRAVDKRGANFEIVKAIVEAGASIKFSNANLENALFLSVRNGNPLGILKYLIEKGGINLINVKNSDGLTFYEIIESQNELYPMLKEKVVAWKDEIFKKESEGLSENCLQLIDAIAKKKYSIVNRNLETCDNISKASQVAFRLAGDLETMHYFEYLQDKLKAMGYVFKPPRTGLPDNDEYSGTINAKDENGTTLLMRMCEKGTKDQVKDLIGKGAKIDIVDNIGENALFKAVRYGNSAVLGYLLEHGGDKLVDRINFHGQNLTGSETKCDFSDFQKCQNLIVAIRNREQNK